MVGAQGIGPAIEVFHRAAPFREEKRRSAVVPRQQAVVGDELAPAAQDVGVLDGGCAGQGRRGNARVERARHRVAQRLRHEAAQVGAARRAGIGAAGHPDALAVEVGAAPGLGHEQLAANRQVDPGRSHDAAKGEPHHDAESVPSTSEVVGAVEGIDDPERTVGVDERELSGIRVRRLFAQHLR